MQCSVCQLLEVPEAWGLTETRCENCWADSQARYGAPSYQPTWVKNRPEHNSLQRSLSDGQGHQRIQARAVERKAEAIRLYQSGLCIDAICIELKISHGTVQRAINKAGLSYTNPTKVSRDAEILKLRATLTVPQIAAQLGIEGHNVYRSLKRSGYVNPKRNTRERVRELVAGGLSIEQAAERLGCHRDTVKYHLRELC